MFPDLLGALGAYSDYYADDTDPEVKEVFMKILNDMWHEKAIKYVDNTGAIKGEARSILEKALQLIHKNKGIHLRLDLNSDKCSISHLQNAISLTPTLCLQFEVKEGLGKDSVKAVINENVFTDNWLPEDDKAGISHKIKELDTVTYRGVRLAYVIYQAIKNI
jgi:hypothetical protein